MPAPRLLHVFSTFSLGGPQARAVQLINAWGREFAHDIVSVTKGELAARELLNAETDCAFPDFPDLKSGVLLQRLGAIRKRIQELKHDLVLTYNWGAVEVVMSNRLFRFAPVIHHEDGFGPDETERQLPRRVWFRRFALRGAERLIVPSRTLERMARDTWRIRIPTTYIPNGVEISLFDQKPAPDAIKGLDRRDGVLQVGTVTGLRKEKNLTRLVRAFAESARGLNARLVIVGEGPERAAIVAEANAQGIGDRVHLPGFLPHPARYVGLFDVFALTSDTEQFPISLVEAMAARLPAVCTAVGDVPEIVAPENLSAVVAKDDERALAAALRRMLTDASARTAIGNANRARVERDFALSRTRDRYRELYRQSLKSQQTKD